MEPRCPYYGTCGGCQLQHLDYREQLKFKQNQVQQALQKLQLEVRPTLGMEDPWFYRNKIQFPIRQQNQHLQMGYFRQKTHEVVNIKECYIQDPFLTEMAQIARRILEERGLAAYNEKTGQGLLRHFIGRSGFRTNELLLGLVINGRGLPAGFTVAAELKKHEREMQRLVARHQDYPEQKTKKRIVGIIQNVNTARSNVIMGEQNTTLFGTPFLKEKLGRFTFNISLLSFFQVNPRQTERLYNLVKKYAELTGTERVVDAYAGIGTIAHWLADQASEVIGLEERSAAVRDAQLNLKQNKLSNVRMLAGAAEKNFPPQAEVVILDPPRGGCSERALKQVVKAQPRRIIYLSCQPESLAQDLAILTTNGFKSEIIQPVDMFPQTAQVETVVKLSSNRG